jgi:uncharacterized protein YndB with AHSA1/START domain
MAENMTSTVSCVDSDLAKRGYQAIVNFNATPDAVFEAITSTAAISEWWVKATGAATAGGELVVWFGDTRLNIDVEAAERASRVHWAVRNCEIEPTWDGTSIIFDLSPGDAGGTRLDFRHQGLTPQLECFEMCSSGWVQALGGLMNYVEKAG